MWIAGRQSVLAALVLGLAGAGLLVWRGVAYGPGLSPPRAALIDPSPSASTKSAALSPPGRQQEGVQELASRERAHSTSAPEHASGDTASPKEAGRAPTSPQTAAPSAAVAAPTANSLPQFDIVRVEPTGESVVAGRAAPGALVELYDGESRLDAARADATGAFALTPPALTPGDHLLALRADKAGAAVVSQQTVAVAVPDQLGKPALAAVTEPGRATKLLSGGQSSQAAVSIAAVEAGEGGVFASGTAPPSAPVRLYLGATLAGSTVADADGRWRVEVSLRLPPGQYEARADILQPTGEVFARASVPFDYQQVAQPPGAPPVQSLKVARGDTLWRISRRLLGQGVRYTQIYKVNAGQIRDPNRIWPGQVLVAPDSGG